MRALALAAAALFWGCPKNATVTAQDDGEQPAPLREARLPAHWSGEGVLAPHAGAVPSGAPRWAHAAAEVLRRDDKRFLRACGHAGRIKQPALALSTAEGRARDELARWLQTRDIQGSRQVDTWIEPQSGTVYVLLELAVPEEWVPGRRLP
jgi:hypothetical protein